MRRESGQFNIAVATSVNQSGTLDFGDFGGGCIAGEPGTNGLYLVHVLINKRWLPLHIGGKVVKVDVSDSAATILPSDIFNCVEFRLVGPAGAVSLVPKS